MNTQVITDIAQAEQGTSLWRDAWLRLRKNRLALFGLGVLGLFITVALLTPWIAPYGYAQQDLDLGATGPSAAHWFGTDIFGRDLLTQIMYGGRVSLAVGFVATAVALLIGITWGAIAGYAGGRVDAVMMRLVDILYALPFMIFIVLLMVVFGRNMLLLFLAIGAVEWLTMARIMRSQVQSLRQQEFVEAAVSLGLSPATIIRRHLVPNALGPIIVYTTLTIPSVMSFLIVTFSAFAGS
jgi:oligopeptide transport system permease protein